MADSQSHPQTQFDAKPGTRVWLITSAFSALGYAVAREALKFGDYVVAGCRREEVELERRAGIAQNYDGGSEDVKSIQSLKSLGGDSCAVVELDVRYLVTYCLQCREKQDLLFSPHQLIRQCLCLGTLLYANLHWPKRFTSGAVSTWFLTVTPKVSEITISTLEAMNPLTGNLNL